MAPYPDHNGNRKRRHQERDAEGFGQLALIYQEIKSKQEREMQEEWDQIQIEQAKQASLADLAKSIAIPGSQLEAELMEDTYNTVLPQGGSEQDSEHSLPDAPGLSANYNEFFELSDGSASDDEEMPPLVRASELRKESPNVETLLHHVPSNNTTIKIDRISIKADPRNYDPNKPFPLLKCEDEVRQRVLQHILTEPEPITPYYYEGSVEGTIHETTRENFPIPMLLALAGKDNKKYYEEARAIFYGWNRWKLTNPRVSLWWLKHIGDNVKSLSDIGIVLSQGLLLRNGRKGTWEERLWQELLIWLKSHHNLARMWVTFVNWDNTPVEGMLPNQYPPVSDARIGVVRNLLAFRGLERVAVIPGPYIHKPDTDLIKKAMELKEGEYDSDVEARHRQLTPVVKK